MKKQELQQILQNFFDKTESRVVFEDSKQIFSSFEIKPDFPFEDKKVINYLLKSEINSTSQGLHLIEREKLSFCYHQVEKQMPYVLSEMEKQGVKINLTKLTALENEVVKKIEIISKEIYNLAGEEFNLNSPKQVNEILFQKLGLKSGKKTASGELSTNSEVLEDLAFEGVEIAQKLIEARHLHKLLNTYILVLQEKADEKSRVHTTFSSTSTLTGRLNSKNPNLQNLPAKTEIGAKIKSCFEGEEGFKLISFDYSQIELRILSEIADVKPLKDAFLKGEDIHLKTAIDIFETTPELVTKEMRNNAKTINFGIIYGLSNFALAKSLKISTSQAGEYIKSYFEKYAGIKKYMEETMEFAKEHGFVRTILGKKCYVEEINSSNFTVRSHALRAAINARIQGSAADLIKKSMVELFKRGQLDESCKMVLQIHDELVFEIKAEKVEEKSVEIKKIMESAIKTSVPIIVNVKEF